MWFERFPGYLRDMKRGKGAIWPSHIDIVIIARRRARKSGISALLYCCLIEATPSRAGDERKASHYVVLFGLVEWLLSFLQLLYCHLGQSGSSRNAGGQPGWRDVWGLAALQTLQSLLRVKTTTWDGDRAVCVSSISAMAIIALAAFNSQGSNAFIEKSCAVADSAKPAGFGNNYQSPCCRSFDSHAFTAPV